MCQVTMSNCTSQKIKHTTVMKEQGYIIWPFVDFISLIGNLLRILQLAKTLIPISLLNYLHPQSLILL
jgi:hypothetical protein